MTLEQGYSTMGRGKLLQLPTKAAAVFDCLISHVLAIAEKTQSTKKEADTISMATIEDICQAHLNPAPETPSLSTSHKLEVFG